MRKTDKKLVTGLHLQGEVYTKDIGLLKSLSIIKNCISKIVKENKLNELGSFYYEFPEGGFTGIISLVESHIAVHTWPEFGYLTLDVFLCNYSKDNSIVCKKVFDKICKIFKPLKITKRAIKR